MTKKQRAKIKKWKEQQWSQEYGHPETAVNAEKWDGLMSLLGSIEIEIQPKLSALLNARMLIFAKADDRVLVAPAPKVSSRITTKPEIDVGPDWWNQQERIERDNSKAFTAAAKEYGLQRKDVLPSLEAFTTATGTVVDPVDQRSIEYLPQIVEFIRSQS